MSRLSRSGRGVGLTTACARTSANARGSADDLIDAIELAGAAGVVLDAGLPGPLFDEIARALAARRDTLPVWAMEGPCPHGAASTAELASLDREESRAAVEAIESTFTRAEELGADLVVVRLGEVRALACDWPAVRNAFQRGELDDDPGGRRRYVEARDQAAPRHVDAARRALERLARRAESAGIALGLLNPRRILGLPSPAELARLLAELEGAPIAPACDLAAAHLDAMMGFRPLGDLYAGWSASRFALAADACAAVTGLPPGRGELDLKAALAALPKLERSAFAPATALTAAEVTEGLASLVALTGS